MSEYLYLNLLQELVNKSGEEARKDRTGVNTYSIFGSQLSFDLQNGFPLLTTKKVFWKGVVHELLWMLKGDTNIKYLNDNGVHIWDEWADENGDLGPVYGEQWRHWGLYSSLVSVSESRIDIDQISNVINSIKNDPYSRRHIVTAWNPAEIDNMALPPCHCFFQFYVEDGSLSCKLYQRSADIFLGVPFNIASYALLTHMIANETGLGVGHFIHTFGDVHLYSNHVEQAKLQLTRKPFDFPKLFLSYDKSIWDMDFSDIRLEEYYHWPSITAEVAV